MLFNHDSGLIQSVLTIDTTVAPTLGGSNTLQIIGTGALILPVGTTQQRPIGVAGMQRFNSTTAQLEYFDGTSWVQGADGTVSSVTVTTDGTTLKVNGGASAAVTTAGTFALTLDQTLVNLAASTPPVYGGSVVRLADDTFISRELVGTAPVTVTNGDGVDGNPTVSVNAELTGVSTLSSIGGVFRTGTGAYTTKTFAKSGDITITEDATSVTFGYAASGDLAALAALGTGFVVKTGTNTYAAGSITTSGTELSVTGTATDPVITYTPSANVAAVNALTGTGYVVRLANGSLASHSITGTTDTSTGSIVVTDGGSATGTSISFTPGTELGGLAGLSTSGLVARTGAGTYVPVTLTPATSTAAGVVTITNGNGTGTPTIGFTAGTELAALSTNTATGLISRDGAGVYTGKTIVGQGSIVVTYGTGLDAGNINVSYTAGANLAAVEALATTGLVTYNSTTGVFDAIEVTGTAGNIVVSAGAVAPVINLATVTQASSGSFSKVTLDGFGRVTGNTAVTTADITALVDATYVNAAGDSMSGTLAMNNNVITGLAVPTGATDAATKGYVDSLTGGLSWQAPVDGIGASLPGSAAAGDRFLNTTDGKVYTATATNTWDAGTTPADGYALFDRATETGYVFSGTDWVQFTGTGQITAGIGLAQSGNVLSVNMGAGVAQLPSDEIGIDLANPTSGGLRLQVSGVDSTATTAKLDLVLKAAGGLTQDVDGLYVPAAGITNAMLSNNQVTLTGNTGTDAVALGESLAITGTGALSTVVGANTLEVSVATATETILGVAKFAAADFTVTAGEVTIDGKPLSNATDVTITSVAEGDLLVYNSTSAQWENVAQSTIVPAIGIDALTDVVITSAVDKNVLQFNGTNWVNVTVADAGLQAVDAGLNSLAAITGAGFVTASADGNTFVTRTLVAGAGVSISTLDGSANPTIANTGVLSVSTSGTGISANVSATGDVTITGNAVTSVTAGTGVSASVTGGVLSVANTGVVALTGTANQVTVTNTGTSYTVGLPSSVTIDSTLTLPGLGTNKLLRTGASGLVEGVALTDGQFLIGATGSAPTAGTITAGAGVTVTNSANGITIAVAGGTALNNVDVTTASAGALTVTAGGTSVAPTFAIAADAGLESLAALATTGIVVQTAADTFATRTLVAGAGVSLVNDAGIAGDITITNTGVTSVALALPSIFNVTGSPVTTTGTLTAALTSQAVGTVFAAPAVGSGAPTFRALAYSDLPIVLYTENTTAKTVNLAANVVTHASGDFATAGDAAAIEMVLRNATTNAGVTELFIDGAAVQAALPANAAWNFTVQVIGRGTGASAAYRFDGIIARDAVPSSIAFIGVPSKSILGETNVALDAAVVADASSGALKVTVTGDDAVAMKWVATIRAAQVIG